MTTHTFTPASTGISPAAYGTGDLARTARTTGLLYLAFFITGILGFMVVRSQLFVDGDPEGTLSNLRDNEALARVGIALELGIVLTQALTAVWFYRLFRDVDSFAAGALAAFGLINAAAILGSAALLATALEVSGDTSLAVSGGTAATAQLLWTVSGSLWEVAGVFFGLWLIPMGWLALRSGWLPRPLGWLLIVGGVGYLLSAFVGAVLSDGDIVAQMLTIPASIGEVWIVGYLVLVGSRAHGESPPGS